MATKTSKTALEFLLVSATIDGTPEKQLPLSRNLGTVELIWPRNAIARKTASREMRFKKGEADFIGEPWSKRILFREEIEDHCGVAVAISEPVSIQKLRKFVKLTAKAIIKEGADMVQHAILAYGDIAAAPIDALATMVGENEGPKTTVQGLVDFSDLPAPGETVLLAVPLTRVKTGKPCGELVLEIRG